MPDANMIRFAETEGHEKRNFSIAIHTNIYRHQ